MKATLAVSMLLIILNGCQSSPEELRAARIAALLHGETLPSEALRNRKLVDYYIPTRGDVTYISFVTGASYQITRLGKKIVVKGPVRYSIQGYNTCERYDVPSDSPCLYKSAQYGSDTRDGELTFE